MRKSSVFNDVLEVTENLSLEEREILWELIRNRAIEERRDQLKRDIDEANELHAAGKIRPASVRQIMRKILK